MQPSSGGDRCEAAGCTCCTAAETGFASFAAAVVQYAQCKRLCRLQPPFGGYRCKTAGCACYTTAKTSTAGLAAALRQPSPKGLAAVVQ
ncbi:hypothetical protein D3Z39_04395 [Anaerotruncus colihominis]|uniref:Uncharacterized protein n=1 Tax=Anaerotruncus colihominis TaxID=169435 RepID=A0A845REM3_9FIRM|nr:hypothetical protein [Anaerotruncus colihominis]